MARPDERRDDGQAGGHHGAEREGEDDDGGGDADGLAAPRVVLGDGAAHGAARLYLDAGPPAGPAAADDATEPGSW